MGAHKDVADVQAGRIYAGLTSADRVTNRRERLLEAGLQIMGTPELAPITVRKVLEHSGVAPRYFYESFADLDALQLAVFDQLIEEAEERAVQAMVTAPRRPSLRIRAVLTEMVDLLLDDPRKGRVLLMEPITSPLLGPRFSDEVRRFAGLLARHSPAVWRGEDAGSRPVRITAQFALGGFAATMTAVLTDSVPAGREALIDDLTALFLGLGTTFERLTR
ncbi:TetR/AcrR family transcriptional regulator [Nocardia sp. NPDC049149]|uniref:TetR/AcrR family transcriptional regulator n=1 Tax=Nocardia sp. NPDC049149 TaxID=3364315 RepID=UPI0037196935